MKIIEPSSEIIEDELAQLSIYQRIAYCAGVCYQREPRKTEEDAQKFCRHMVSIGHLSTLEMAVIHLRLRIIRPPESKFLLCSPLDDRDCNYVVSGSVRSLLEACYPANQNEIKDYLASQFSVLFTASEDQYFGSLESRVRFALPSEIPWQHQHVAVRFIVNRAVSHELVRHRPMSFLQESQRYCRYGDEVVFIRPEWCSRDWTADRQSEVFHYTSAVADTQYKILLANGLKPQQARAVLSNSTKTELIAYASLPQWKHIFKLRCSPAADPEMRKVMIPLEREFKGKYPEAFNE